MKATAAISTTPIQSSANQSSPAAAKPDAKNCIVERPGNGTLKPFDLDSVYNRSYLDAVTSFPKDVSNYFTNSLNQGVYRTFVQTILAPQLLTHWQNNISSEFVLNVHEDARDIMESNAVWAIKHETTPDYMNVLPSLVAMNKKRAGIKAIMRGLGDQDAAVLHALFKTVKPFAYQVKRPRVDNVVDKKAIAAARDYNEDLLASARLELQNEKKPTQVMIFPEGTTCTDGRVIFLHNGVFEMGRDGAPVVPVGLNYDLIAGEKRSDSKYKYRAFMNVGKPFYYKPEKADVKGWAMLKDRVMHHIKLMPTEREIFRTHLKNEMVALQSVTCGGLLGHELLKMRNAGALTVDKTALTDAVIAKAAALAAHSPIDEALLDPKEAAAMIDRAWKNLCDMGYLLADPSNGSLATIVVDVLDREEANPGTTIDPRALILKKAKKAAKAGEETMKVGLAELIIETKKEAKILAGLIGNDGLDTDMQSNKEVIRKVGAVWNAMCEAGWISEGEVRSGTLNPADFVASATEAGVTVLGRPYDGYKKANPLRFCANSLHQKAEYDAEIAAVLSAD
jgi:hypothetical protein